MARPPLFPDWKDRTINEPNAAVTPTKLVELYNFHNKNSNVLKKTFVDDEVRDWFKNEALNQGWSEVNFVGSQALLHVNLKLISN